MRLNLGRFGLLTPLVFSLFFMFTPNAKADEAAATPATTPVEGQGNTLSAAVTGVSELPEVTVKAHGIDQAAAFDQMHDSLNKVNILSQDQINQTPAKTIAQAAEELPGVGTQHDTSEPRYIDIRGTDSDLNIVTFNETIVPSYDEANRSVDLDDIPAGLVGEMELYKTILPNMDAQGIGGQLNLVPKMAQDYPGGLFELKGEAEYFPERSQPGAMGDFTWADTYNLGGPTKLGFVVAGGYQYSHFGIDDLENAYTDPANGPLIPESNKEYEFRYYDYERQRAGIGANIDLSMDRDNKLYANLMYSGYDEYRDPVWHTTYHSIDAIAANGASVAPDGTITVNATQAGVDVEKDMTDELTQFRTLATGVGGSNNLGGFILDYKATYSYADQNVPYDYGYEFDNPNVTGTLTYNNTANNGNMPTFNFSGLNGTDTNASQFVLDGKSTYGPDGSITGGASNSTNTYTVNQYGLKADGKTDMNLGGDDTGTLKFGAASRWEYSVFNQMSFATSLTATPLYLSDFNLYSPSFYPPDNIYNMGPLANFNQITNLLTNPNQYEGSYFQNDPVGDQGADYTNWEDVYAGYAMYTVKSGPMEVMGGARIEVTHIQYNWWRSYADGPNGPFTGPELNAAIPESGTIDYTNVLPSLGMKYTFNPTFITRINYSETIARPTQNQYIPTFSLPQALDAQSGDAIVNNTYGNPNLKPMVSNNIDSSWEWYPQKGAILGVDFFLKDIANYIATNYAVADNSVTAANQINNVSYFNIPYSQIYGAEFQYQQQYIMLPGFLSGLGYRGSISFIGSSGEITPGIYSQLPSQSDLIWETGVFYKKSGLTVDVAGNFTGKNLTVVGDPSQDNSPNVYYDDYFQINAKAQYAFTKDFSIYADWNNINNADLRYYQAAPNYPIQNEYYGPSYDGGIDVTF